MTRKLRKAARIMAINLIDHIIIGDVRPTLPESASTASARRA